MRVYPAAADLVSAGFGEVCQAEAGEQGTHNHNRSAQPGALLYEFRTCDVEFVDAVCREGVVSLCVALYLYAHALQKGDEVFYVQDFRDIGYSYCAGGEEYGANDFQRLVFGSLGGDAATQAVASFYYE